MRTVAALTALGGLLGAAIAAVLRSIAHDDRSPRGWWTFSDGRQYVDYLATGARRDTGSLFAWSVGSGLAFGLVLGALLTLLRVRITRVPRKPA
jgi:hypothetical protein